MRRSVLCVSVAVVLCFVHLPEPTAAQTGLKVEDVILTRTNYPSVQPLGGHVEIYAGDWTLDFKIHNYSSDSVTGVKVRTFVDNVFFHGEGYYSPFHSVYYYFGHPYYYDYDYIDGEGALDVYPSTYLSMPDRGEHEVTIQVWCGTETQPQDIYSLRVVVMKPEVSSLQANSRVVRALGDNSLAVSFTNSGNENMRQAVLSVADPKGLTITPSQVELGDVRVGQSTSANFNVSSPAGVTLGTVLVRFSLSFIDYAGISHTEDVSGAVEVYRLSPTLTLSLPNSVESGSSAQISAVLRDPSGAPIPNENIILSVGGSSTVFKTDSNGVVQTNYKFTETGTRNMGASFAGSASYDAASASGEFTVTPATAFPYWVVLLIALLAMLGGLAAYLRRRGPRRAFRRVS